MAWEHPDSTYELSNREPLTIDAHQHFWKFDAVRDAWIDESMGVLRRDFLPGDLEPLLESHLIDGCVAVQAEQSEAETAFLLQLASRHPRIRKVVGWVDFCAKDIADRLMYWKREPRLSGFRHILQAEPPEKMEDKAFRNGIAHLAAHNFTYDLLIYPQHMEATLKFVDAFPHQPFVVDHLAKPGIRDGAMEPWRGRMRELARRPHVCCKLSGMVTEAGPSWQPVDLRPYMDVVLEAFGPSRLMYGSDWPVCLLAADYERVVGVVSQFADQLTKDEAAQIMGGTASRFYGITN